MQINIHKNKWTFLWKFSIGFGVAGALVTYVRKLIIDGFQYEKSIVFEGVIEILTRSIFIIPFGILIGLYAWKKREAK